MTELYNIAGDASTVADLRDMRALYREGQSLPTVTSDPVPSAGNVIVELISDISAGDHSRHRAKLVTLVNGAWVDTGQRPWIRNVGADTAEAGLRLIARPIGRLGLCVYGGCPVPADVPAEIEDSVSVST